MHESKVFTIGFTKKSAEEFFTRLSDAGIKRVIDVRLNNVSQLAGFAKRDDLAYFLKTICQCAYWHEPLLAPTKEIMDGYKNKAIAWEEYEKRFLELLEKRKARQLVSAEDLEDACLLCAEPSPENCHRRLVAEYLGGYFDGMRIYHL
ncbi:MAG: DUF488 domain-containing protein [Deltaproteobacteria bacterium]|jgi:uncharacterized protein (DUF488 family)